MKICKKCCRIDYLDSCVAFYIEQMIVTRDNEFGVATDCAFDVHIIIRVIHNDLQFNVRFDESSSFCYQAEKCLNLFIW